MGRVGAIRYLFPSRRPPARQHPFEVGQHQDVKQFRMGSWPESIEAFTELTLDLLQVHGVGH